MTAVTTRNVFGKQMQTWSVEDIARALIRNHGLYNPAAADLGMSRIGLVNRIRASIRLQALAAEQREATLDLCENRLIDAIDRGEPWAIRFYLQTIGKHRGYTEKLEVEHSGSVDVAITEVVIERPKQAMVIEGTARELPDDTDSYALAGAG